MSDERTALDKFEIPEGMSKLHPFDIYELIESCQHFNSGDILTVPDVKDEADYARNRDKLGCIITIDGKAYFQTTSVKAITRRFS